MRRIAFGGMFALFVVTALAQERPKSIFPKELVEFESLVKEPIFKGQGGTAWDAKIRERGWIMKEKDRYRMWYTGFDGTQKGLKLLGLAESADGLEWERHGKPLVNDSWVEDMHITKVGDSYWMVAEGECDRAQLWKSADGVAWTHLGKIDVRLKSGAPISDGAFGTPTLWVEGEKWHLFYERGDRGIWLAVSTDAGEKKVFTNVQDEEVIAIGPDAYDRDQVAMNQIVKYQGRYYGYYHGSAFTGPNAKKWCTCVAVSDDLVKWTKYEKNPLLPIEWNVSSGIVLPDGERTFRLYTMHPEVRVFRSKK